MMGPRCELVIGFSQNDGNGDFRVDEVKGRAHFLLACDYVFDSYRDTCPKKFRFDMI